MKKLLLGLALMCSSTAFALPMTIGFDDGANTQDGTISWAGGLSPLVGSGIDLYTTDGTATPLNQGIANALECRNCELSFITGAYTGAGGQFNGGGSFDVAGELWFGLTQIATGPLLTGVFTDTPTFIGLGTSSGLFVGLGSNTTHTGISSYFGLPSNQQFSFATTQIALGSCVDYSCVVTNADIDSVAKVPIPGTLALMAFLPLLWRRFS